MKHYAEIVGGIALTLLGVILFIALSACGKMKESEEMRVTPAHGTRSIKS